MYSVLEIYHISQAQTNVALTVLRWGKPFESEKMKVKVLQVVLWRSVMISQLYLKKILQNSSEEIPDLLNGIMRMQEC